MHRNLSRWQLYFSGLIASLVLFLAVTPKLASALITGGPYPTTHLSRIAINPGTLVGLQANRVPLRMSAAVYDLNGRDITSLVSLSWGISSTGSLGTITPQGNQALAIFVPLGAGSGDLFVHATYMGETLTQSIPVQLHQDAVTLKTSQRYFTIPRDYSGFSLFVTPLDRNGVAMLRNDDPRYSFEVEMDPSVGTYWNTTISPYQGVKQLDLTFGTFGSAPVRIRMKDATTKALLAHTTVYFTQAPIGAFAPEPDPTPTPCLPRPPCLDAQPRCLLPEPVGGWCPVTGYNTADGNSDGRVDGIDYVIWLNNFGKSTQAGSKMGDYNLDTVVDGIDYVAWLNNFGK